MDDPNGSSRGTHNYPSPNAARSHTHSDANPNPPPPSTPMRTTAGVRAQGSVARLARRGAAAVSLPRRGLGDAARPRPPLLGRWLAQPQGN